MVRRFKAWVAFGIALMMLSGCAVLSGGKWDKQAVFYEIFLYSFYDSNGDGIGDFKGLTEKLDYLNDGDPNTKDDLGITGIWLMPIMQSPSTHKYDVVDYYSVDKQYGTMEDFEHFIKEAHKRGIKVIIDMVINHTSANHPWFKEAKKDPNSPYRDYYLFTSDPEELKKPGPINNKQWYTAGNGEYYNAIFWDQMPDLNFDHPAVREEMKKIGKFWLDKGVDGFRLDAAKHLYSGKDGDEKNIAWWNEYKQYLQKIKKDVYLVGEVWDNPRVTAAYFGSGLDTNFNFSVGELITNTVKMGRGAAFSSELNKIYESYKKEDPNFIDAPFLTNHDQNRVMSSLDGNVEQGKMAASLYLTLPGNPFIYYGEEIGMMGVKPDENIREPLKWYANPQAGQTKGPAGIIYSKDIAPIEEQIKDENSMLAHYRRAINIRQSDGALLYGDFVPVDTKDPSVVGFMRTTTKKSTLVLHNVSREEKTVTVAAELIKDKRIQNTLTVLGGEASLEESGQITIPGMSSVFISK